jgi:trypsin
MNFSLLLLVGSLCFVASHPANVTDSVYVELPIRENVVISAEEPEYLNVPRHSSRVVGGVNAPRGMFNYMVRLHMLVPGGIILCGGSLFSATHILTADHCIPGGTLNGIEAHLGVTQWNGPDHRVAQVGWFVRRGQGTNPFVDLAIFGLSAPVQFSDTIAPVGMPRHGQANDFFVGQTGLIAGWGGVNDGWLKYIPVRYVTQGNCGTSNLMLCAAGRDNFSQNVVGGDSGGPIVIQTGNFHTLVGCVSFGFNNHIGATHVPRFLPWITEVTGILFPQ